MKVYILRHAESVSYSEDVPFSEDPRLSELGVKQAELTAKRLKNLDFDLIISSSARRSKDTAVILNEVLHKEVQYSDILKEMHPPKLEISGGGLINALQSLGGRHNSAPTNSMPDPNDRRDETFIEVEKRASKILDMLNSADREILIVTHSTFSRILVLQMILGSFIMPEQVKGLHIDHAGLSMCLKQGNRWKLINWNDTDHLIDNGNSYLSQNRF